MEHSFASTFNRYYSGKRVLITGHTGFKGGWLAEWLLMLGAEVVGIALPPETQPALFHQLGLEGRLTHHVQDICEPEALKALIKKIAPDVVFHLAAQSLVRSSYKKPVETFETNVMGTVHVLESVRALAKPCVIVCVTTDKCYENREWEYGYRENDPLGGYDPYSASKACAEHVIASYRSAFFNPKQNPTVALASARAGNVVGGGDFAMDRLLPDCVRSLSKGEKITIRMPDATRPWQHVLDPLSGYLLLGQLLGLSLENKPQSLPLKELARAFNFGPWPYDNYTVTHVVETVFKYWPGEWNLSVQANAPHEAGLLMLSIERAYNTLGWQPVWDFEKSIEEAIKWYKTWHQQGDAPLQHLMQSQIERYTQDARIKNLIWAL